MSARLYRGPKTTRPTRSIVVKAKAEIKRLDAPHPLPAYELAYKKPMYDKAWPLTEDDIDLPTEPPAPDLWAAEDGDYLGTITIFPRALRRCPLDLDVMRLANGDVALGSFEIPRLQARALIQLINAADDIDLPTEPPAPDLWAAEDGDYLGTITIFPRALRRCPLDLDVMRLANGDVALGPFEIPRLQARALIQLINAAYQEPVQEGRS